MVHAGPEALVSFSSLVSGTKTALNLPDVAIYREIIQPLDSIAELQEHLIFIDQWKLLDGIFYYFFFFASLPGESEMYSVIEDQIFDFSKPGKVGTCFTLGPVLLRIWVSHFLLFHVFYTF